MNVIPIKEPRWRDRVVLVADWKIAKDNLIQIAYAPESGIRAYPLPFYITGDKARTYPTELIRTKTGKPVPMRAIPLNDLDVYLEEGEVMNDQNIDQDTEDWTNFLDSEGTDDHADVTDPREREWEHEA